MRVQLKEPSPFVTSAITGGNYLRDIVGHIAAVSPQVMALILLQEEGMLQLSVAEGIEAHALLQAPEIGEGFLPSTGPEVLTGAQLAGHSVAALLPESVIVFSLPLLAMDGGQALGQLLVGARAEGALTPDHLPLLEIVARQIASELDRQRAHQALAQAHEARQLLEKQMGGGSWAWHVAASQIAFSEQAGQIFGQTGGKSSSIAWTRLLPLVGAKDRRVLLEKGQKAFQEESEIDVSVKLRADNPRGGKIRIWGKPVFVHNKLERFEGIVQRLAKPERDRVVATSLGYELRGEICALKDLAAMLVQEQLGDTQRERMHLIHLSAQYLSSLFDYTVDPVSMTPRELKVSKRAFNLRELLHEIHKNLAINTQGKKLDFDLVVEQDIPEYIVGDPQWLEYILKTLLINSFLFTKKGYVKIIVDVLYQSDRELVLEFTVVDSGVGVSDEGQLLFGRLSTEGQVRQSSLQARVMGLELANRLVDLQHGALHVNSTPNEGTEFYFKLKFGKASFGKLGRLRRAL